MSAADGIRTIVLIGAGGFSRETVETLHACIAAGEQWKLLGFLDDGPGLQGTSVDGYPVLGPIDSVADHPDAAVIVGTGRPDNYTSRLRIVERLALPSARYARVVHPSAALAESTVLGAGSVILAGVVATTTVTIGEHVAIMPGTVLTHDDVLDDYVTIAAGVRLGGNVHVGTGAYLGSGVLVREGVSIGAWSMIGMGSVVTRDVPPGELWFGSPARRHREAPVPPDLLQRPNGSRPEVDR